MKFMTRIGVMFYVTTILFVGCAMLLFVLNAIDFDAVTDILYWAYTDMHLRVISGLIAIILLVTNFMFANVISDRRQMEKTIAFDNPSGRVTISLTAMEELVKRLMEKNPDVKEGRANIIATKKGLDVYARLTIRSDVNIPELTASLQDIVRRRVQDTVGLEEPIMVRMHVVKIVDSDNKPKRKDEITPRDKVEKNLPFHGYRA